MNNYDVIIVGAGISGLSFAHYAAKAGMKTLVVEKSDRPGGSFHTSNLRNNADGFWIEMGAHTCYNSYRNLIEIMEDCGAITEITPRAKVPFQVLTGGQIKSFFSQINIFELLVSLPKAFGKKKTGETVASYYGSILGRKNFANIFSALFSAVPSQNADDFPADALFKRRERRKDTLKHFTMKNGLGSITDAIAGESNIERIYGLDTKSLEKISDGYLVKAGKHSFSSANIAICTSALAVPEVLKDLHPEIAAKISQLKCQTIESFGVVVSAQDTDLKPFAGLVPTDEDFFSVVSRDTVPHEKFRGFTFHFKPGILTKELKISKVCDILHIKADQIVEMDEKINIVPSLRLGHYALIDEIDALLEGNHLFLSGNYFGGLSIEDCVSRSKSEVERLVKT
jgi:protoporphyrinogen/coproporphyrinogen III oxidase